MAPPSPPTIVAPHTMPQLPNECLLIIARHAAGSTLQNFRLSSRAFRRIADPVLWKEVRLVPNIDCLQTFHKLITGQSFASHVQTLIYDTSWQSLSDELRTRSSQANAAGTGSGEAAKATALARCLQAQVNSAEGTGVEMCLLTQILTNLPNVQMLKSNERLVPRTGNQDAMPPYYRTICKNYDLKVSDLRMGNSFGAIRYVSHVRSLLLAAFSSCRCIQYLDLAEIPWTTFFQDTNTLPDPSSSRLNDFHYRRYVFKSLKYLDVAFRNAPSKDLDTHLRPLCEILKACDNLQRLRLCLTDYVQKRYSTDYRMFSFLGPFVEGRSMRPLMPNLRKLHIASCICTQNHLISFLMMHATTLRDLTLSDISLLRQEDNDMRGCWVQVIQSLRHVLRLDKVTFKKWLSNGGRQRWHVSEDTIVDQGRLRPQVERFVTRRSSVVLPVPLEAVAVRPGNEDVPKSRTGMEEEGDWTWTMTYGQSKTRDTQPDTFFSGAEFFSKDVVLDSDNPESSLFWDDWDSVKPSSTYPKHTLTEVPYKGKSPPPAYGYWYSSNSGVSAGNYSFNPSSLPAKKVPLAHKPYMTSSSKWATSESSNAALQDPWFNVIPPVIASHHIASKSSKPSSTASTNSNPPYAEDDPAFDEVSYHSPSQHSLSQPGPPYTPSYSSHGSSGSFDTLASWYQPPGKDHHSNTSVSGSGGSDATSSKHASHPSYNQASLACDDTWANSLDFGIVPGMVNSSPPPPTSAPVIPFSAAISYGVSPEQATTTASQSSSQPLSHVMSTTDAFALLEQAQNKMPPYGGHTYAHHVGQPKNYYVKPSATPLHGLSFGISIGPNINVEAVGGHLKENDETLKKKAGIESYGVSKW